MCHVFMQGAGDDLNATRDDLSRALMVWIQFFYLIYDFRKIPVFIKGYTVALLNSFGTRSACYHCR